MARGRLNDPDEDQKKDVIENAADENFSTASRKIVAKSKNGHSNICCNRFVY